MTYLKQITPPNCGREKCSVIQTEHRRESGIELLRIIAMFLVLTVHCGFRFLGIPTAEEAHSFFLETSSRLFFQNLSIGCVDIFVLISGWFGIKLTKKGLGKYLFQCLYFSILLYVIALLFNISTLDIKGIVSTVFIGKEYWFVKSYLCLLLCAPILNEFVKHTTKRMHFNILIALLSFQTVFAWIYPSVDFISNGYSVVSFSILYLLARYVRLYIAINLSEMKIALMIVGCILVNTVTQLTCVYYNIPGYRLITSYINPLVIFESLLFVVLFSRLKFSSNSINIIASSCFAVYLLHTHVSIFEPIFGSAVKTIYNDYNGFYCLMVFLCFLSFIFVFAILLDQPRKFLWKLLILNSHNNDEK